MEFVDYIMAYNDIFSFIPFYCFILFLVFRIIRLIFQPSVNKLKHTYSSLPEYDLFCQAAVKLPNYFKTQQSPSFAKDQVELMIFYSTISKALLQNNFINTGYIDCNNMHFVYLTANAAAKAIEDQNGSIRDQYNFACAIVFMLVKKEAFKFAFKDYCSNKITEILEKEINVLSVFKFRKEYYPQSIEVNNRNSALTQSVEDDIFLKAAKAFIKNPSLSSPSWFSDQNKKSIFNQNIIDQLTENKFNEIITLIAMHPDVFWSIAYACANAIEMQKGSFQDQCNFAYETITGCVINNCIEANKLTSDAIVKFFKIRYEIGETSIQDNKKASLNKPQSEVYSVPSQEQENEHEHEPQAQPQELDEKKPNHDSKEKGNLLTEQKTDSSLNTPKEKQSVARLDQETKDYIFSYKKELAKKRVRPKATD